jgi:hypothetical protein
MPANPLLLAQKSGVRMNKRIGDLFAQVGSSVHPRGEITTTYKQSRLALRSALGERNKLIAAQDVLRRMRADVQRSVSSIFSSAVSLGDDEARRQLSFYGQTTNQTINLTSETQSALDAVMARFDAQAAAVRALVVTDAEDVQIAGDENSDGVMNASDVAAGMSYWIAFLVWNGFESLIYGSPSTGGLNFEKQAIAAIDMRTTNCCLKVHGQVQPFNKPFELKGSPRFADTMDWPGFHYYCRTSAVLYVAEFDDGITAKLIADAKKYLK